jgi:hypothetical protein
VKKFVAHLSLGILPAFLLLFSIQTTQARSPTWNLNPSCSDFIGTADRTLPSSDAIYETNYRSDTIKVFSLSGADLGIFGMPSYPTGLVFDNSGNLYVSSDDPAAYAILKYTPGGSVSVFANTGLNGPHALVFDNAGNLYVANSIADTIEKFTPDGVGSVFADAADGLNHPVDLAFDTQGNLYVSNSYGTSVEKFTPDGVGSVFADSGLDEPYGLAFDSAGNLYVSNYASSTIEKFAPDGTDLGVFASTGVNSPHGIIFDSTGNLYVANNGNNTIEKFSSTGVDLGVFASTGLGPHFLALGTFTPSHLHFEIEALTVQATSAPYKRLRDPGASGGAYAVLKATVPGDFVTYSVPVVAAGTYKVTVGIQTQNNRGIFQLAIAGVNQGSPQDEYSPTIGYEVRDLGTVTVTSAGNLAFQFVVTGRNSSSRGYSLAFDYIDLDLAQFHEVTAEVGLVSDAKQSWGNPIWADINNDGFLDLIVPTYSARPFVYLNNSDGTFTDIRGTCGIVPSDLDSTDWRGFAFGDYDGDGNVDLYVTESAHGAQLKRDLLFKGHGDGTFENVTVASGIETSSAAGQCAFWVDYDNDGKLDLFVKNYASPNRLYKNNGDGTFTQVADAAGLADATLGAYHGTICSFADYDNDGFMDVAFSGERNVLYRNSGGTFVDVTAAAGMATSRNSTGIAWGDYNNDGLLDLYIARGTTGSGSLHNTLYRSNGDGTFIDVTAEAGLVTTANTWAAIWGDYDNDGFLDLFVTCAGASALGSGNANLLYHNNGDGTFTNVAAAEGVELEDNTSLHKGAAWVDYNNDGFPDLLVKDGIGPASRTGAGAWGYHRLFKNNGNNNHFINVNLTGVQSNRRGIGARVTVTFAGGMSFRENNGGGGGEFTSQGSEPLHFGIGTATLATVEVKWPSGITDTIPSVAANSTLTVVEGSQ